ncbi:MAG: acylneuraminate cytidylyltransferase family protein [Alphaproteobacteria bacterium]|nr:acylneuraminate cytidylyltransferase family protein [Alphaproteobacteria bacterium]
MTWKNYKILAVIPARGGSKGIPYKNLQKIGNISLIGHSANVAKKLKWIDRIVLSTDDQKIADEGLKYGIEVPFMRPANLASDTATGADAWKHAWLTCEELWDCQFDISILLQPTTPLRKTDEIEKTLTTMLAGNFDAATTVSKVPGHYTPQKIFTLDQSDVLHFYCEDGHKYSNRQAIPSYYTRNGLCYAVKRDTLINHGYIVEKNCAAVIIDRPIINIDDPYDLELARFAYDKERNDYL